MLEQLIKNLTAQGVEVQRGENGTGLTEISATYFSAVSGGAKVDAQESLYGQYAQNYGDNGPHPQPYWQDVR